MRKEYVAGREARILLSQLIKDGYNTIRITSGEVTHRDLVIAGVPGDEAKVYVEIEDGYKGRILLENCEFTGKKREAAIDIGKDCDVTISISGENKIINGGIRVASTSNLMFEGDGKLIINVTKAEAFGIGNDMDSYHGDIVFDQDGLIDITINSTKGVAIGSGLGGHISIRRGAFKLNLMGQQSVGIGSISGDIEPLISNCALEIKSVALSGIGVGSFLGRCDIMIEHTSVNMDFFGNDVILVGSKHSDKLQISVFSASFTARARSNDVTVLGSGSAGPTIINIDYLALKVDIEGKQVGIYRGVDKSVKVRISNTQTSGKINTTLGIPKHAADMDFKVNNSSVELDINGHMMTEVSV